MTEFKSGDVVRVKAALLKRPNGTRIMRGQTVELTDEDVKRSDIDLLVEAVDEDDLSYSTADAMDEMADVPVDFEGDITHEGLVQRLEELNLREAKKYLSHERWELAGMQAAREAELAGKNRTSVIEFIDNRILELTEDEG